MSLRNILLFLLSIFVGILLFTWVYNIVGWEEIKNVFINFNINHGLIIFGLTLLIALMGSWRWQEILKGENVKLSFFDVFYPYLAGFSIIFLAPILVLAGEMLRAVILKEKNLVSWSKSTVSIIIDRVLEWTTNLIVIFLGALFFLFKTGLPPQNLSLTFGAAFFIFVAVVTFFYIKALKKESIVKIFSKAFNHNLNGKPEEIENRVFDFFKIKNKLMWQMFFLSFARVLIMYIRTWLLIVFLGTKIALLPALSVLGFSLLAVTIPIPAALGSHEAIQVFTFNSLGLNISSATAFTLIIRASETILALIGLIILFKLSGFLFKNNFLNKIEKLTKK